MKNLFSSENDPDPSVESTQLEEFTQVLRITLFKKKNESCL